MQTAEEVKFLKELKNGVGYSNSEIANLMFVNESRVEDILLEKEAMSWREMAKLTESLNVSLESVANSKVNYNSIRAHKEGRKGYIQEKYTTNAFSKKSMIANIFDYIEKTYGPQYVESTLLSFQLTKEALLNPESDKVNYKFFEDIISHLQSRGLSNYDLTSIGYNMIPFSEGSDFASEMQEFKNIYELYSIYLDQILEDVEQNNRYELYSITHDGCKLRSFERDDVYDIYKVKKLGSENRCKYRAAALAYAPMYIGAGIARVKETKCVHRGDSFCEFDINFAHLIGKEGTWH